MSGRSMHAGWARLALAGALALTGCERPAAQHEHASEHPEGHDHHAPNHGHGDAETVAITRWSERLELFAEHSVPQVGKPLELLAHLTVLDGFGALDNASVRLTLSGPVTLSAEAAKPARPGIYRLQVVPTQPGTYRGRIEVSGALQDAVDGFEIEVGAKHEAEHAHEPAPDHDDLIELLKEQQWGLPFATAFAQRGRLAASIEVAGRVATPPSGSAEVGAQVAGRLVAPAAGLPRPGDAVRAGQLLATLAPAPSSPEEAARAGLLVSEADARLSRARAELERATRLVADQALSARELDDARRELGVAEQALRSARETEQLFRGAASGRGGGSFRLLSPIEGTLVEVQASPGASVAPGTVLFRIVDTRELWIVARVSEEDAARFRPDADAGFALPGVPGFLPIDVTGDDANSTLLTVSRAVDPVSRTVDVVYALRTPDPRLRVGGLLRVSVPVGDDFEGVVVPASTVVDDDGQSLVYVQRDGEHFEARRVQLGPRHAGSVGVASGLMHGERVVTLGAQVVRLQSRGRSTAAHGHIH